MTHRGNWEKIDYRFRRQEWEETNVGDQGIADRWVGDKINLGFLKGDVNWGLKGEEKLECRVL